MKNQLILFVTLGYSLLILGFGGHDFIHLVVYDEQGEYFLAIPAISHLALFALFTPLICKNQYLDRSKKIIWIAFCLFVPVLSCFDYIFSHRRNSSSS